MVKYCCFTWTQELILKPLFFLAKIWVWQWLGLSTINQACKRQEPSHSRGDGICPLLETESCSPLPT
jgi:hypothetical protein